MNIMASAFKTTIAALETDLAALIVDEQIAACIDSANKRLYARNADERVDTFEKALAAGDAFTHATKSQLLRLNLRRAHFIVNAPRDIRDVSPTRHDQREKKMRGGH
jgi:COP9 signalosome complex subunit 1